MKIKNTVLLLFIALIFTFFYSGCDDSGVTTVNQNTTFSSVNLQHLNISDSVMYELFVNIDSSGGSKFCSMGKFNINASGQPVDDAGNAKNFQFDFTPDLPTLTDAFITLEPLTDFDTLPNGILIMGASRTYVNGVLTYNMSMEYPAVLGNIAVQLKTDAAQYIFATPTDGNPSTQFFRGMWYTTDPVFGNIKGITCQSLAPTNWIYHAFVISLLNPAFIYNVGKFSDPAGADDFNGCSSNFPPWNIPGQDWLMPNCPGGGIPDIDTTTNNNLNSGNFQGVITIEPRNRPASLTNTPFFIKVFSGNIGVSGFGIPSTLPNVAAANLPTATISITTKSGQ